MATRHLTLIRTVLRTADRLAAPIPPKARSDFDALADLADGARTYAKGLRGNIAAAVVVALESGNDPATDPGVARAITQQTIVKNAAGIDAAVEARAEIYTAEHALAVLASFAEPFDRAAATMTAALDRLGDVALSDARTVAKLGPDAAAAWAEVHDAEQTIDAIRQAWAMLAQLSHAIPHDPRHIALIVADVPPAEYLGQNTAELSPWDLARRGWPLELATPDTYRERLDAIRGEQTRRQAEHADGYRQGFRRAHGVGAA